MGTPRIQSMHAAPVPNTFRAFPAVDKAKVSIAGKKARGRLTTIFPRIPSALWDELGEMVIHGPEHQISRQNDPYIHAYLLSQEFGLVVQKIVSDEVGFIPVHAKHGCAGCSSNGLRVAIVMQGFDNIDIDALQRDFERHIAAEFDKFRAVGLL
jgi:hypothetical protein